MISPTETHKVQWLRRCQLLVGKDGTGDVYPSTGLLIEGLRISFDITKTIYRTPNVATIKVYNLNPSNEKRIVRELNDVILQGGYQSNTRLFFRGNIKYALPYREGNDRICEICAGDGDKDFHGALVNFTLAAGHTDADLIHQLLTSFKATTLGRVHGKNLDRKHSRGRVISGNARDILDRIAEDNDAHWSIQDGKLVMVPVDSTLPNEAIEVSSATGLVGAPEANDKGITVKMFYNPQVVPGGKIWLRNNEVKTKQLKAQLTGQKRKLHGPANPVRLDPDGVYKVYAVHATGDTRAPEWFGEVKCVALDAPIPSIKGLPQSSTPDGDIL